MNSLLIPNVAVLNIAEMFERFAYYGVRSILILFLCSGLTWDRMNAAEFYGTFTLSVYFASILGGLLADLTKKPALIAIIGNSVTSLGIFLLAFAESPLSIYVSAGAIALGSGIWKPSIIGALYRVSFTHKHRFDLVLTIFYCAINLGAFAAPLIIGGLADTGDPSDFRLGFIVAGCFSFVPTILLGATYKNLISNDLLYDNQTYKSSDIGITNIVLLFVLTIVFWLIYELFPIFTHAYASPSSSVIMMVIGFIFYLIMIPLHLIPNLRSALKISIGLLMVALVCFTYPILDLPPMSGLILLAIAEVLIIPVLWSQIIQFTSPRFTAVVMSLLMFVTVGINKAAGALSETAPLEQPVVLWLLASVCVALMIAFMALDHFQKKREQNFQPPMF
jgi:dipeptide/tripeptide permease